jgi:hypothetical protein
MISVNVQVHRRRQSLEPRSEQLQTSRVLSTCRDQSYLKTDVHGEACLTVKLSSWLERHQRDFRFLPCWCFARRTRNYVYPAEQHARLSRWLYTPVGDVLELVTRSCCRYTRVCGAPQVFPACGPVCSDGSPEPRPLMLNALVNEQHIKIH